MASALAGVWVLGTPFLGSLLGVTSLQGAGENCPAELEPFPRCPWALASGVCPRNSRHPLASGLQRCGMVLSRVPSPPRGTRWELHVMRTLLVFLFLLGNLCPSLSTDAIMVTL